jgi:hypothetical protein
MEDGVAMTSLPLRCATSFTQAGYGHERLPESANEVCEWFEWEVVGESNSTEDVAALKRSLQAVWSPRRLHRVQIFQLAGSISVVKVR